MRFYGTSSFELKKGGSPVTAADHASNAAITEAVRAAFPDDAILSEETVDTPERITASRVWIIDPLDGTKEFLAGIPEFAVMIALLQDNVLRVAAVYQPAIDTLYFAVAGHGAFRTNGHAPQQLSCERRGNNVRVVGSRSHTDPLVARLCEQNGYTDVEPCGSVGVKCARIAEGKRDLYVHPVPYMGEWDTAAPELILTEAGGCVTDCRGGQLRYNKPNPTQPNGILAAHPALVFSMIPDLLRLLDERDSAS